MFLAASTGCCDDRIIIDRSTGGLVIEAVEGAFLLVFSFESDRLVVPTDRDGRRLDEADALCLEEEEGGVCFLSRMFNLLFLLGETFSNSSPIGNCSEDNDESRSRR